MLGIATWQASKLMVFRALNRERSHVKDASAKLFHHETPEGIRVAILAFLSVYDFAEHLEALRWRAAFQAVRDACKADPTLFKNNPTTLARDHSAG